MSKEQTNLRLREWMDRAGVDHTAVAAQLGVTTAHVSHLVQGSRRPSLLLAVRLQRMTGIPAADWVKADDLDVEGVPV